MISYLDLLKLVDEDNAPDLIELNLNCGKALYQAYYDGGSFNYYGLCNEEDESQDFRYYLGDTLLESQMVEDNIRIINNNDEELNEKISKLQSEIDTLDNELSKVHSQCHSMRDRNNYMKEQLKSLMKIVNAMEK